MRKFEQFDGPQATHVDMYRTYLENGDSLAALSLDDQRVALSGLLREFGIQWKKCRKNLERFEWRSLEGKLTREDIEYGDFEFRKELKDIETRIKDVAKRIADLEKTLDTFYPVETKDLPVEDVGCLECSLVMPAMYIACQKRKAQAWRYENSRGHWAIAHDVAKAKERKLRVFLLHSSEKQDKLLLVRIDTLKNRRELTGPWYWLLSMLVIKKHTTPDAIAKFSVLSKEDKRKARRAEFWAAAGDRMVNFRKANEKSAAANGREWVLPNDKVTLEVKEVPYNDLVGNPFFSSEDALIAAIDERAKARENWFLMAAMERASWERVNRDMARINKMRNERKEG